VGGEMKSFLEDYSRIIGFLLLVFVIIIVFSTPFMILARTITMFEVQKEDPILLTVFSFILPRAYVSKVKHAEKS
jgi:hypothetical protein